jgi:membrane fusion protein, multidrug efflux system
MKSLTACLVLALSGAASAAALAAGATQEVTVLVKTVTLERQVLPDVVAGYGVIAPSAAGLQTLSLPRPGQVLGLRVRAGERVKRGEPLLEFGNSADAELAYRQAQEAFAFAKGEEARVAALHDQQLATRSQLATARKAVADAEAALRMQQGIGAGRSVQTIVAPFDGLVTAVSVAQGDRVGAGVALLQIARSGAQHVLLGVEPDDARVLRQGMPVSVNSVVDPEQKVNGRVDQVFGMIDPKSQLVDVLVDVPASTLLAGARVSARIEVAHPETWVVPRSAVLRDARGAYLFQVLNGKARRVDVQTGLEHAGLVAVNGRGLDPAQPVVSLGNYELHDGMAVRGPGR